MRRLALPLALCVTPFAAAPAAAQNIPPITLSTPSEATVQVIGTALVDDLTVERVDGTRTVRFAANRGFVVSGACRVTGARTAECIAQPVSVNPILPEPGIVFFGSPVIIQGRLGRGNDTFRFLRTERDEPTQVTISGDSGNDTLTASGLRAGLKGVGNRFPVVFFGGSGDDVLTGGPGRDTLVGGDGDDVLVGGSGDDSIDGGDGDDVLVGGPGDDRLVGAFGGDVLSGGTGRDTVQYQEIVFTPDPASADPFAFLRSFKPRAGIQVAVGDGQCLDGGPEDVAAGTRPAAPAGIATSCGTDADGVRADEVLGDVEVIVGSQADDVIIGDADGETLVGGGGDDQLEGGAGADSLLGEDGDDTLLLRDGRVDLGAVCGSGSGDRALADADDPVDLSCEVVDRGDRDLPPATGGATLRLPPVVAAPPANPAATVPAAPAPPPAGEVATEVTVVATTPQLSEPLVATPLTIPTPAPADSPPQGTSSGGPGPGGGDGGATAPEARIVSRTLAADRRGRLPVLVTCVYRARACEGTVSVRAGATVRRGSRRVVRGAVIAQATVTIPWGRTARITLPLGRSARTVLAGRRTRAIVRAELRDASAPDGRVARLSQGVRLAVR